MARPVLLVVLATVFQIAWQSHGHAQNTASREQCAAIFDAVAIKLPNGGAPTVPDEHSSNWTIALPCLLKVIENLSGVDSPRFSQDDKNVFMSATGALRTILARLRALDQPKAAEKTPDNKPPDNKPLEKSFTRQFIDKYRELDNLRLTTVMTYGARSVDPDIRLNALLIMGNTVDNKTLCVPLDHLYDPVLGNTAEGVRGRANLVAIVSVPAPWAYRENFDNLTRVADYLWKEIPNEPDFKQTRAAVETLRARLKSQEKADEPMRDKRNPGDCRNYVVKFGKDKVTY